MAVQFILGTDPNKKREEMIDYLYNYLEEYPESEIIYLVPDNVKYEAEIMVLEQFKKNSGKKMAGMINLQIFSFSRFAWYLLQDQAIYQQAQLTESGLAMLLKKIIKDEEEKLTIYRGASQERGFIQRLIDLFSEFRNGKINPDDLDEIILAEGDEREEKDFKKKMEDISHLYKKYDQALEGRYIEREDLYQELARYIKKKKKQFENTIVYIDHYEHFSAQELELLTVLAKSSKQLMINLTLSKDAFDYDQGYNNLFYRPLKTFYQLKEEFESHRIEILDNFFIGNQQNKLKEKSELEVLKKYWLASNQVMTHDQKERYKKESFEKISLWETEDIDSEIFHIASQIKKMVASGKYRYNDFQIMTRNLENYELSIEAIFKENEIPFFIDEKESMAQHPLLEFIVSLFSLKKRYYQLDDIFRLLRTELFLPLDGLLDFETENEEVRLERIQEYEEAVKYWREQVDLTENVALAFGYQGSDWTHDEDWHYSRMDVEKQKEQSDQEKEIEQQANQVRKVFQGKIVHFIESLDQLQSNRELANALYQFMEKNGIINVLEFWRSQLIIEGQLEEAEKHEQAWARFISLLDEFVEVLGDEAWDLDSFLSVIETGFEEADYSMVPPTIDQVLITNYDLPKIKAKRIIYLIGLTDTELPKVEENQSLLTDEDRELIESALDSDKYLAVSSIEDVANEPFGFYLALLQAKERIFFTYPRTNTENEERRISPYLTRIKEALGLETEIKYAQAISRTKDLESPFDYLEFIVSKDQTFGQMMITLRHSLDRFQSVDSFWGLLFNQLYDPKNKKQFKILRSLSYKNIPVPLNEDLAKKLYGKDLQLSVSQLESFYTDPYSHFLIYGLKLHERQLQELTPLESGNYYHDALDQVHRRLIKKGKDINQLSEGELDQLIKDVAISLLNSNKYRLARSSHRMQFIFDQLTKTVKNTFWSLVKQSNRSKFRPFKTELIFGPGNQDGMTGLEFNLKNDRKIHLRGKIDRIDYFQDDNQLFVGIVDYKSSDTNFDYRKIYHGLMLQMVTYLDTVLTFSNQIFGMDAEAIGAFYSTVRSYFTDLQELGNKELDLKQLEEYRYKGFMIYRENILNAADQALDYSQDSAIYPIRLNKDSYSLKGTISVEELEWLIQFNREKIIEAGQQIISGKNTLRPFDQKVQSFTPSVDGPYRAISQFDALLKENNYKEVDSLNEKEFFELLKEKYGNEQEDKS